MLYFDAFLDLQYDRNESEKIPWSVIVKYCEYYKFSDIQTENTIYFIRCLDREFSKWSRKKGANHGENIT